MDRDEVPSRFTREAFWSAERQLRFRTLCWKTALARAHSKTCRPFGSPSNPIKPNQTQ
jgi:hypothetical protein